MPHIYAHHWCAICTIIARRYKTLKRPVISCKKTVWFQSNDKRSYTGHTHFWHEMKKKRHMLQTRNTLPVFTSQKQRTPIVTAKFKNRPIVVRKNLHFIFYQENYMSTALRDTFRGSKGLQQSASVMYNLFKFQVWPRCLREAFICQSWPQLTCIWVLNAVAVTDCLSSWQLLSLYIQVFLAEILKLFDCHSNMFKLHTYPSTRCVAPSCLHLTYLQTWPPGSFLSSCDSRSKLW